MKKVLATLLVILVLAGAACACAETKGDYSNCLYRIRVGDLWGYIDYEGQVVIEPQYTHCGQMRGQGYAWFTVSEMGNQDGIIDKTGKVIVEPAYTIDEGYDGFYYGGKDEGTMVLMSDENTMGFFNVANGYFSGMKYMEVANGAEEGLIQVVEPNPENSGLMGYADVMTGEMVIPFMYSNDTSAASAFSGGYATVQIESENGDLETFLIDKQNNRIPMPQGYEPCYGVSVCEGMVSVMDLKTGLCGYADLQGNLIIDAKYSGTYAFEQGVGLVYQDETPSYIDKQGNPVEKPESAKEEATGTPLELKMNDDGTETAQIVDGQGNVLVAYSAGYMFDRSYSYGYENFFSEGYQVLMLNGKYGFVNEQGEVALAFEYDDAENFENGLAYVVKDGVMSYVNHDFTTIWKAQ